MSKASDFLENELLDHIFKNSDSSYDPPATLYVALLTSAPDDDDDGSDIAGKETTYGNYARQAITTSTWSAAGTTVTGTIETAADITFPESSDGPHTITHFAILTGNAGDDTDKHLVYGTVSPSLSVNNGVQPIFKTGDLSITCA